MTIRDSSRDAALRLGQLISTADGRELLARRGHVQGREIVLASWDDLVTDSTDRLPQHEASVTLAVFRPEIGATGDLCILRASSKPRDDGAPAESQRVGRTATLGLVWQTLMISESHRFVLQHADAEDLQTELVVEPVPV